MGSSMSSLKQPVPYILGPLAGLAAVTYSAVGSQYWEVPGEVGHWTSLLHLSCISISFGSQLWHYFIASPSMLYALSRHDFGKAQQELFPRLFTLNSLTGAISLSIFMVRHPLLEMSETEDTIQFCSLLVNLLANVTEGLLVTPYTAHIKKAVDRVEKDHNLTEISSKRANPTWVKKNAEFIRWHGLSMGLAMIGFLGNSVYMYYLAKSLKEL